MSINLSEVTVNNVAQIEGMKLGLKEND